MTVSMSMSVLAPGVCICGDLGGEERVRAEQDRTGQSLGLGVYLFFIYFLVGRGRGVAMEVRKEERKKEA